MTSKCKNKGFFMPKKDLPYSPIGLDLFAVEEKFMARYAISNERKHQGNVPLAQVKFCFEFFLKMADQIG